MAENGFRKIIEKLPGRETEIEKTWMDLSDWDKFKRHHALYFWPDLILEKIIESAGKKQKDQMGKVLDRLDEKNRKTFIFQSIVLHSNRLWGDFDKIK